jgi:rubrerythrin
MAISSAKNEEHEYQCLKCEFKWPNFSGPQECPMCNSPHIKWLNYKEEQDGD